MIVQPASQYSPVKMLQEKIFHGFESKWYLTFSQTIRMTVAPSLAATPSVPSGLPVLQSLRDPLTPSLSIGPHRRVKGIFVYFVEG